MDYVCARVLATWRPGDEIVYLSPDDANRMVQGTLLEVEAKRRFVFEGRLVFDSELANDEPHREPFELEDLGNGICRCIAIFDHSAPDSPTYRFQSQGRRSIH